MILRDRFRNIIDKSDAGYGVNACSASLSSRPRSRKLNRVACALQA